MYRGRLTASMEIVCIFRIAIQIGSKEFPPHESLDAYKGVISHQALLRFSCVPVAGFMFMP